MELKMALKSFRSLYDDGKKGQFLMEFNWRKDCSMLSNTMPASCEREIDKNYGSELKDRTGQLLQYMGQKEHNFVDKTGVRT